ncbi:hypothetical protein [Kitasatospora indigofera]|uniref:hypothetical protein n=1 Tax=Kitasatospora indigofera TaxID=67307 RepID=UPI0033B94561
MTGRLLAGGGVLLHRVTAWWGRDGVQSGIARVIGTILGVAFALGMLAAAPVLWWPLAAGWLVASWACTPANLTATAAAVEEDHGAFLASLHLFIGAEKGVHLAQLAAGLLGEETATDRIREMCEAAGVPITRGVRVKDRGVSTGIRRDQLPPLPPRLLQSLTAGVAAGQHEQQQQQHTSGEGSREGFWIKDDPGNPARAEIHWIGEKTG